MINHDFAISNAFCIQLAYHKGLGPCDIIILILYNFKYQKQILTKEIINYDK